jgi:hypothetical protein
LQGLLANAGFRPCQTSLRDGLRHCLAIFHDSTLDLACKFTSNETQHPSPPSALQVRIGSAEEAANPSQREALPAIACSHADLPRGEGITEEATSEPTLAPSSMPEDADLDGTQSTLMLKGSRADSTATAVPKASRADISTIADARQGKEQDRSHSLALRGEEGHIARAAALKNVFREELELAWRRYRDAASDGKPREELPSQTHFFGQGEHRGVLV